MLGYRTSVSAFRWDLVYLLAQLTTDTRPGVAALGAPIQALLVTLKAERGAFEDAEDATVVATALLQKKDRHRDAVLTEAGGVARASDKVVYGILFPQLSPSATARLGIAEESAQIARILGELAKLPDDHPLRTEYQSELVAAEAAVKAAGDQSGEAATALALQRSQLDRFKLECDQGRLTAHGQLVTLLKSKAEADTFFRPNTTSPAEEGKEESKGDSPPPAAPVLPV